MADFRSNHFVISQTEDGWILQSRVVKDVQGDLLLSHHELEELIELLSEAVQV
ncbi:MAG: hypothetical protein NTV57_10715 [Cyanobacteria bacterium]|nr:hypothetical protein [Cyanobacteriota bacterium]